MSQPVLVRNTDNAIESVSNVWKPRMTSVVLFIDITVDCRKVAVPIYHTHALQQNITQHCKPYTYKSMCYLYILISV